MTVKKTAGYFIDCKQVMDLVLQRGDLTVDFDTYGAAVHFRQRCYRFRKLLFEAARPAPGALPATVYDSIIIRCSEKGEEPPRLTFLNREDHGLAILSRVRTVEGEPLSIDTREAEEEALRALRGTLGLEDDDDKE